MDRCILLVCLLAFSSVRADTSIEVGPTLLSSQFSKGGAFLASEFWGGEYGDKYSVGVGYIYKQEVTDRNNNFSEIQENIFIQGQRRFCAVERNHACFGIGVAHFQNTNRALGATFNIAVSIEVRPQERLSINLRHYSNAGSAVPNMGQDMITIGYRF